MDETSFLFLLTVAWLAQGVWVFFDATERYRVPIPLAWSLAALVLPPLALIIYLAVRGAQQSVPMGPHVLLRQYLYVASLVFLATLFFGLAETLRNGLLWAWLPDDELDEESVRRDMALGLAVITISLPVYGYHWFQTVRRFAGIEDDQEFRGVFLLHRAYVVLVLGISSLIFVGFLLGYVFELWQAVLDVSDVGLADFSGPIAWTVIAVLTLTYHYPLVYAAPAYANAKRRFESIEPLEVAAALPAQAPVVQVAGRRCAQCGASNPGRNLYCSACGAQLAADAVP